MSQGLLFNSKLLSEGSIFGVASVSNKSLYVKNNLNLLRTITPNYKGLNGGTEIIMQKDKNSYYKFKITDQTNKIITRTEYDMNNNLLATVPITFSAFYFYSTFLWYFKNKIIIQHRITNASGQLSFTVLDINLNILNTYILNSNVYNNQIYSCFDDSGNNSVQIDASRKISIYDKNGNLIRDINYPASPGYYGTPEFINNDYLMFTYMSDATASSAAVALVNINTGTITTETQLVGISQYGKMLAKQLQLNELTSI